LIEFISIIHNIKNKTCIISAILVFISCGKIEDDHEDIKSVLHGIWFSSCINYKKTSFNYDLDLKRVIRTQYRFNDSVCVYSDNKTAVIYNDVSWSEQTVKDSNSNYLNAYKFVTHYQGSDVIWYAAGIKNITYKHGYNNNSYVIFETFTK